MAGMTTSTAEARGLTNAEVEQRIAQGLTNNVPVRASRTIGEIIRANVFTRFNAMIGALFVVIIIIGPVQDGLFGYVIVINTLIGIVQEWRAKRTLDRLAILGESKPRVHRDDKVLELLPHDVVLDDLIELGPGEEVVVDGVVVYADGLEVDESLLTGEADPMSKGGGDTLLSGSFAVAGAGVYRATKVGREAYAAQLAEEASRFTLVNSQLRQGINVILRVITWLFLPAGTLIIYSQLHGHDGLSDALRGMVAALVPMVPEGLLLLTSVAFAVGVIRLGRRQCLVQELPAIEGLARVDTVCADKTGTLTENGMRLARTVDVGGGDIRDTLAAIAAADASPNASMRAIADAMPSPPDWRVVDSVPFSSAQKWSGVTFDGHGSWLLGAPDVLLPRDSLVRAEAETLAAQGLRVLVLCKAESLASPGRISASTLLVLEQRIRPDAHETLRYFADQQVEVKVISGDNAASVGAVAASLDLHGADAPMDARQLADSREDLADQLAERTVFGRVTPAQKRAMVGAMQSRGHNVAMTGDGVNDVLALKDADIGVAMGSGSPATRAVAQIVLLDNRFATLPYVVAEGRRVIGNIERVASLFLTKTVYSVLLALVVGASGVSYPFLPRHLTLVGTLTIGVPAFFLALAPNSERARPNFVRRVMLSAIPAGVVAAAATLVTFFLVRNDPGSTETTTGTAALVTLTIVAMWVLAIVARPYRWWKVGLISAMVGAFALAIGLPAGRDFFALSLADADGLVVALVTGLAGMVAVEVIEQVRLRVGWPMVRQTKDP